MSRNESLTCRELIEPALKKAGWSWERQVFIGPVVSTLSANPCMTRASASLPGVTAVHTAKSICRGALGRIMNRDFKTGSSDDVREAIALIRKEKLSSAQPNMMAAWPH